jgi:hypothetical protein
MPRHANALTVRSGKTIDIKKRVAGNDSMIADW